MDVDSSAKFIGSLTKFLQSLCNGYVEFQRGVELVGHIYLSIDTGEKVDYILHEKVSKNDENSVTFVSNSFHAQPLERDSTSSNKNINCKSGGTNSRDTSDDDDDIMIVDQSKSIPGSSNLGTVPCRGPSQAQHTGASFKHSQGSSNPVSSPPRTRQPLAGPSATVTSQGAQQENFSMGEVKLEQISRDELLSLASQVNEEASSSHVPSTLSHRVGVGQVRHSTMDKSAGQPVWIKQEVQDELRGQNDSGWQNSQDGQSDTSNSGSNLYPVMLHQNPAFNTNPVFPGFSSSATVSHQHDHAQPHLGTSGAANSYVSTAPGTSQNMSGIDPTVHNQNQPAVTYGLRYKDTSRSGDTSQEAGTQKERQRLLQRQYRQRVKENPILLQLYRKREQLYSQRYREKQRAKLSCFLRSETKYPEV